MCRDLCINLVQTESRVFLSDRSEVLLLLLLLILAGHVWLPYLFERWLLWEREQWGRYRPDCSERRTLEPRRRESQHATRLMVGPVIRQEEAHLCCRQRSHCSHRESWASGCSELLDRAEQPYSSQLAKKIPTSNICVYLKYPSPSRYKYIFKQFLIVS